MGADIEILDEFSSTMLLDYIRLRNLDKVTQYLSDKPTRILYEQPPNFETNLFNHICTQSAEMMIYCIQHMRVDIHHRDINGRDALMWATAALHGFAMEFLLKLGMDINSYDNFGDSVLHFCLPHCSGSFSQFIECLKILMKNEKLRLDKKNDKNQSGLMTICLKITDEKDCKVLVDILVELLQGDDTALVSEIISCCEIIGARFFLERQAQWVSPVYYAIEEQIIWFWRTAVKYREKLRTERAVLPYVRTPLEHKLMVKEFHTTGDVQLLTGDVLATFMQAALKSIRILGVKHSLTLKLSKTLRKVLTNTSHTQSSIMIHYREILPGNHRGIRASIHLIKFLYPHLLDHGLVRDMFALIETYIIYLFGDSTGHSPYTDLKVFFSEICEIITELTDIFIYDRGVAKSEQIGAEVIYAAVLRAVLMFLYNSLHDQTELEDLKTRLTAFIARTKVFEVETSLLHVYMSTVSPEQYKYLIKLRPLPGLLGPIPDLPETPDIRTLRFLLSSGADPNIPDSAFDTPLVTFLRNLAFPPSWNHPRNSCKPRDRSKDAKCDKYTISEVISLFIEFGCDLKLFEEKDASAFALLEYMARKDILPRQFVDSCEIATRYNDILVLTRPSTEEIEAQSPKKPRLSEPHARYFI